LNPDLLVIGIDGKDARLFTSKARPVFLTLDCLNQKTKEKVKYKVLFKIGDDLR